MTQSIEISGFAATIALLLPLAVLAILVVLVLRGGRRRPSAGPEAEAARAVEELTKVAPSAADVDDVAKWAAAAAHAENAGDEGALPPLLLALAKAQGERGLTADAQRNLTRAIRIAAQSGDKDTHAAARLRLGDLVQAAGDLTTACEHWQIARALFQELGGAQELAETEARMRRNGCPTDWVLNDF